MNIEKIFEKFNVINKGHFIGTSGKHLDTYINKDAIYPHTKETSFICKQIALYFKNFDIDTVASPALGGIILSQWTAFHLSNLKKKEIYSVYIEKINGELKVTRGYDKFIKDKKVLVLEDNVNTGLSVKKVIKEILKNKGSVVGVGCICNRGNINKNKLKVKNFFSLHNIKLKNFNKGSCPMCKKGVPVNSHLGKKI